MNQLLIVDNREYIIFDSNFIIVQASLAVHKYADGSDEILLGQDIRDRFPELIGLENICQAILNQEQTSFQLNSIARSQASGASLYFDLYLKRVDDKLIIFLENVTELILLRQSLVQRINESEILLTKLKSFEDCTNRIVASMADVLFITDSTGIIERFNNASQKLLGYKKSQLLNQSIDKIVQDQNFNHQQIYQLLLTEKQSIHKIEVACLNSNQKIIEIEFNCFVVATEIEDIYSCVYMGRDITTRKQAAREVQKALAKEQELRRLKSGFISMASHEFRNPLSSILLCTEVLDRVEELTAKPEYQLYLRLIKQAALNMQYLLEDILVISKTEAGKQNFKPTKINLELFCQQIIQEIELTYQDRIINFSCDGNLSAVCLDEKVLWHILNNLLSNALKYSPESQTVGLKLTPATLENRQAVSIEVQDRGIGIPPQAIDRIFESFYRSPNVGDIAGTGLGLSIVKKSVDLHQGKIIVDSQLGQGTKITAILPIDFDNLDDNSLKNTFESI